MLVAATGDEPTDSLTPAFNILRAVGVAVDDLKKWGSFVFVMQKGYAYKTVLHKTVNNTGPAASLGVYLSGTCS